MSTITKKKKSILISALFIFLLSPFFKIQFLTDTSAAISLFYKYSQILSFTIIFFLALKNKTIGKFTLLTLVFCAILILSTLLNNADISSSLLNAAQIASMSMLIEYGLKTHPKIFLMSIEIFLSILIYINFALILLFPDGLYGSNGISFYTTHNWLLGFKNNQITYILPALLVSFINTYSKKQHLTKRVLFLIIISLATLSITKCATGLITIVTFSFLIILLKTKIKFFNNIYAIIYAYIALFFSIVFIRIQTELGFFITDLLGKDTTFTGRIAVWDFAIDSIQKKPLLGYGVEDQAIRYYKDPVSQTFHAHNEILEICYKTGIVGFAVMISLFLMTAKELHKNRDDQICKIIIVAITSFLIMALAEYYSIYYLIFVLCLGYNNKYIVRS